MNSESSVVIIGAGLAGLLAAMELKKRNIDYIIVDKGRSVGGRMATRRIDQGKADHGAQFFTARSDEMKELVGQWMDVGVAREWTRGFHQMNENGHISLEQDGYPRYIGQKGMNALTKHLAIGLNVELQSKVQSLTFEEGMWALEILDEERNSNEVIRTKSIITTVPVPQALTWMDLEQVEGDLKEELLNITYEPCIGLLIKLNKESRFPSKGGIQGSGDIAFIGDNQQKRISHEPLVTVHASGRWSENHFEQSDQEIMNQLLSKLDHYISREEVVEVQVKRWRYAKPKTLHPEKVLNTIYPAPIVFAGDCFQEGKVEGAILSGMEAGKWIANVLKS